MSRDHVRIMIDKAARTDKSHEALQFSQAACNAANALRVLHDMPERKQPKTRAENDQDGRR